MNEPIPWTPRPYQLASLEFLIREPHGGLLLDPGLGKTSTTLAAYQLLKEGDHARHILVVAPLRVAKTVWPVEAKKWADFKDLTVCDLTERDEFTRIALLKKKFNIYVINPESLEKVLALDPWEHVDLDMLVIDESTKFKDPSTKRFKYLKKYLHLFRRRIILTGTPAPNGLQDLFGQMYVVDMGKSLGKYITHFRMEFMRQSYDGYSWVMAPGMDKVIYQRIAGKVMRLMAKDHIEMPELLNVYREVTLEPKYMAMYKEMEKTYLLKVADDTVVAFTSAALGTKCRQIANGFIYNQDHVAIPIHGHKLDELLNLVDELQGRPLIIAYEFIEDARAIQAVLPGAVNIGESTDVLKTIADFNQGKIPILMGHPKSMGHGLNLQEVCHDICWFGITWDLELYQQAIARIWRQGQPSPVVVCHHIVAKDTLDAVVIERLGQKDFTQTKLNEALKTMALKYKEEHDE